jgi:hypothetical protein
MTLAMICVHRLEVLLLVMIMSSRIQRCPRWAAFIGKGNELSWRRHFLGLFRWT